jgi:nuclear pore complex protein Nup160
MAFREAQYLFKETRLSLEPPSSAAVVNIKVPIPQFQVRTASRRQTNGDFNATEEELAFRRKNLASASSVFHRRWHDSPRSFLWRILEDGTILSVRAVDVCKQEKVPDTPLVLNFHFSMPIRPSCLALADSKDHDALYIFVMDQDNFLHSLTLRPDAFRKRSFIDSAIPDLCKSYRPSQIHNFKHPHRLVADSADHVVVTLHDGGIIRMDRNTEHDGGFCFESSCCFPTLTYCPSCKSALARNSPRGAKMDPELEESHSSWQKRYRSVWRRYYGPDRGCLGSGDGFGIGR